MSNAADLNAIRLLLRGRLATVSGVPSATTHTAWENQTFKPPAPGGGSVWMRETLLIASERKTSSGFIMTLGEYRLDVFNSIGEGTKDLDTLSQAIAEAFKAGVHLGDASLSVDIYRAERLTGRPDPGIAPVWYMIPIVISWRSFTSTS